MGVAEAFAIFVAGAAAGTVNAVVGSGSLITFPTLLAFGFPPVVANVSNNVGLVPGNFSGAWGYRRELAGQRSRLLWLGIFSVLGAVAGAAALLALPAGAFKLVVPVLILASCVLVLLQPRLSARIAARRKRAREEAGDSDGAASRRGADQADRGGPVLAGGVFGAAIYGGYFGAAQGVLVIGLLGTFLDETMQRINGAKNVLVGTVNGIGGHRVHHLRPRELAGRAADRGGLDHRRPARRAHRPQAAAAGAADLHRGDRADLVHPPDLLLGRQAPRRGAQLSHEGRSSRDRDRRRRRDQDL